VRKNSADQLTRIDKLKKQADAQDTKIQDLKRAALADQTEIKDLRSKLRSAEAECAKLKTKSEETVRTKQALDSTNAARLDELKERERRIAGLEKAVGVEKKRREDVESQLRDVVSAKTAEGTRWSSESVKARSQLEQAQAEIAQVRAELDNNRISDEKEKEDLVAQLDCLRDMLGQAATHYGKLVSDTVSKTAYDRLRREQNSLQFHSFRLERKLANTEAQVAELAGLIRQSQETIDFLESQLRSAEDERSLYRVTLDDFGKDLREVDNSTHILLVDTLFTAQKELLLSELEIRESLSSGDRHLARAYAELNNQLVSSCATMRAELTAELLKSQMQAIQLQTAKTVHDGTTADLHAARAELESTRKQLVETSNSLDAAKAIEIALAQEVKDVKSQSKEQATAHRQALQKEKDSVSKLTTSLQQSKVAEDELRTEIDQ
jgi:chromosome segregation ATPase